MLLFGWRSEEKCHLNIHVDTSFSYWIHPAGYWIFHFGTWFLHCLWHENSIQNVAAVCPSTAAVNAIVLLLQQHSQLYHAISLSVMEQVVPKEQANQLTRQLMATCFTSRSYPMVSQEKISLQKRFILVISWSLLGHDKISGQNKFNSLRDESNSQSDEFNIQRDEFNIQRDEFNSKSDKINCQSPQ